MTKKIIFFSNALTPRLRYTIESIVGNLLGVTIIFTQNEGEFIADDLPKINYSKTPFLTNELFIENHTLLFENTIKSYVINSEADFFGNKHKLNSNYSNNKNELNADFNFDIFARIFYLVSRYEEYHCPPSVLDAYNRFPSTESVASKLGFLQEPLVNQYVIQLSEKLKSRFPNLEMTLPIYSFQPTFDIDMAWLYRNKGFTRNLGGFLKDILNGKFNDAQKRLQILRGIVDDPYFTFEYIQKLHQQYGFPLILFWLLGDLGKYDKNIDWKNREFQKLIQSCAEQFSVGIHPSYRSNDDMSILKKEVGRLSHIVAPRIVSRTSVREVVNTEGVLHNPLVARTSVREVVNTEGVLHNPLEVVNTEGGHHGLKSVLQSRQHFLKLTFPETYRRLLAVGIQEDWTMGYADETGFRASIATPFHWFDIEKNETTRLIIHPFQAMDVTLKNYLHLTPKEATERLQTLIATTKRVGGTFTTLWHNDNLAEIGDWKGWRIVYERLLKDANTFLI